GEGEEEDDDGNAVIARSIERSNDASVISSFFFTVLSFCTYLGMSVWTFQSRLLRAIYQHPQIFIMLVVFLLLPSTLSLLQYALGEVYPDSAWYLVVRGKGPAFSIVALSARIMQRERLPRGPITWFLQSIQGGVVGIFLVW